MAPNKFEKQLKDILEGRSIAPSQSAWSQLDSALETKQNKRKFPFWWLGIAATFLGVFLAVFVFNNQAEQPNAIVDDLKNEVITPNNTNDIKKEPIVNEDNNTINKIEETVKVKEGKRIKRKINKNNIAISNKANNFKEIDQIPNNNTADTSQEEIIVNTIVKEESASSKEAKLLLDEAYTEVKANNNTYKSEKIDANSLLEEVEIKSEKSLKNRLFHAVKSGYETLRTTVAERNN